MRLTTLAVIVLALLACSCPKNDSASEPVPQQPPAAEQAAPRETGVAPDGIVVYHDPVLGEPLKAFAKKVYIQLAEDLDLQPADLAQLATVMDSPDGPAPQIVIFGYAPALPELVAQGVVVESTARTFAGDRLVLAEKEGTGFSAPTLFDAYRLRFTKLGYLDETTALGKPSHQALVSDGLLARIEGRTETFGVINELFGALLEDRVQLAVLPASLVAQSKSIKPLLVIGEDLHEDIRYIAAATPDNEDDPLVQRLLALLAEDAELQKFFAGYGLLGREAALIDN